MAGKKSAARELFLDGVRAKWFTLDEPDYKFSSDGNYGIGVLVDEQTQGLVNAAIIAVENDSGESGTRYDVGDTLKLNMSAGGINKKTKVRYTNTLLIYNPDTSQADAVTIKQLSRKSKLKIKMRVQSYPEVGKPDPETGEYPKGCRAGGISTKFVSMQILQLDGGEPTAAEQGFTPVEAGVEGGNDDY
jgi:hypothetical protein